MKAKYLRGYKGDIMSGFDDFVKRYATSHGITVEEALTHKQVMVTKEYYDNQEVHEAKINEELSGLLNHED